MTCLYLAREVITSRMSKYRNSGNWIRIHFNGCYFTADILQQSTKDMQMRIKIKRNEVYTYLRQPILQSVFFIRLFQFCVHKICENILLVEVRDPDFRALDNFLSGKKRRVFCLFGFYFFFIFFFYYYYFLLQTRTPRPLARPQIGRNRKSVRDYSANTGYH